MVTYIDLSHASRERQILKMEGTSQLEKFRVIQGETNFLLAGFLQAFTILMCMGIIPELLALRSLFAERAIRL